MVTRKVLLIWLKEGITVEVRPVLVSELVEASKMVLKGNIGAGTAAVVNPIIGLHQDVYYELPKLKILCCTIKR
jgi:branched-chain amino acid aminotransferase